VVEPWRLVFTKQARKDAKKLSGANLRSKAEELPEIVKDDPFRNPPRYEKLVSDLAGACSRRINIQQRLVYQVLEEERVVKILRMWTYYE
jgi:toxin YoeB